MKGKPGNTKTANLNKLNIKLKSKSKLEVGGNNVEDPNAISNAQPKKNIIGKDGKSSISSQQLVKIEFTGEKLEEPLESNHDCTSKSFRIPIPKELNVPEEEPKLDFEVPVIKPSENTNNIKVVARFRPLNSLENDLLSRGMGGICVKYNKKEGCTISNSVGFAQSYTFDRVFDSSTDQKSLFDEAAKPVINDILLGYNGTIFTYGQSGSGKTHTMYGSSLYDQDLKGIIPRSIEYMFDFISDPKNENIKFQIKFSMLEIYKEALYDLLNPEISSKELKIKETKDRQIYVSNLTEEYITNIEEFLLLIFQADQYRVVSETGLNKQSSRSHLLFIIEVLQQLPDGSEKCGKLNLVDLAGSEKIAKSGAVGETLDEAIKINLSLSTLGMVISSLSSEKDYIPYRDSKLTRILKDSLGGNYKTTLIVACSPHVFNSEETNATLKFAMRAKKIKNKVKQNIKKSTEELEKIIEELSQKLTKAKNEIIRLKAKLKSLPQSIIDEYKLEEVLEPVYEPELVKDKFETCEFDIFVKINPCSPISSKYKTGDIVRIKKTQDIEEDDLGQLRSDDFNFNLNPKLPLLKAYNHKEIIEEKDDISSKFSDKSHKQDLKKLPTLLSSEIDCQSVESNIQLNEIKDDRDDFKERTATFKFLDSCNEMPHTNSGLSTLRNLNTKDPINYINHNHRKSTSDSNTKIERDHKILSSKIEKLEEQLSCIRKDKEKMSSSNILLKENNIHLKEQLKELTKNSDNANKLDIVRVEEILSKIELLTQEAFAKLKKSRDTRNIDFSILAALEEENSNLRSKILEQESEFYDIFKQLKMYENENFVDNAIAKSVTTTPHYNSIFENPVFVKKEPSSLSYSHTLTFNRSFFKDILLFFTSKFEFFNGDIYTSTNGMIQDLEKAKANNIKSAFIKSSGISIYYEKLLLDTLNKAEIESKLRGLEKLHMTEINCILEQYFQVFEHYNNFILEFKRLKLEEIANINHSTNTANILTNHNSKDLELKFDPQIKAARMKHLNALAKNGGGVSFNFMNRPYQNDPAFKVNHNIVRKVFIKQKSTITSALLSQLNNDVETLKLAGKNDLFNQDEDLAPSCILLQAQRGMKKSETSKDLIKANDDEDDNYFKDHSIMQKRAVKALSRSSISSKSKLSKSSKISVESNSKVGELPQLLINNNLIKKNFAKRGSIFKNRVRDCMIENGHRMKNFATNEKEKHNQTLKSCEASKSNLKQSILGKSSFIQLGDKTELYNHEKTQGAIDEYTREIKQLQNEVAVYKTYVESVNSKLEAERKHNTKIQKEIQAFESKSNKIHRNEIENIYKVFQSYKDFHEQELDSRKQIIENLLLKLDDCKLNSKYEKPYILRDKQQFVTSMTSPYYTHKDNQNSFSKLGSISIKHQLSDMNYLSFTEPSYAETKNVCHLKSESSRNTQASKLATILSEESRSATKKFDFLKLMNTNNNNLKVTYGNGLSCKNKGKSPLMRNFVMTLKGDSHADISHCDSILLN